MTVTSTHLFWRVKSRDTSANASLPQHDTWEPFSMHGTRSEVSAVRETTLSFCMVAELIMLA
jgi:hypothetical protein